MASNRSPRKDTGVKRIPLFSGEGRELVSHLSLVGGPSDPDNVGGERNAPPFSQRGEEDEEQREESHVPVTTFYQSKELSCLTCSEVFVSREEQVEHYRLDWHRYNLKRKLKGLEPVNQDSFERIAGDLSSISGSESSSDDDEGGVGHKLPAHAHNTASPRAQRKSQYFHFFPAVEGGASPAPHSVYRCIVTSSHHPDMGEGSEVILDGLRRLGVPQVWLILMRSGGHFAGAVFRGAALVAHKTFHRYTVRAKRGTAQSVRDGQQGGHQPKSAGASLRRHNESMLANEIRELVSGWREHVEEASCIFIRTPKHNKGVLVGDGKRGEAPFLRGDPRLREIPFPTRRPTLKEVQAVHAKLAAVYVGVAKLGGPPSRETREVGSHIKSVGVEQNEEPEKETEKNRTGCVGDQPSPNNDLCTSATNADTMETHPNTADTNFGDPDLADVSTALPEPDSPAPTRGKRKKKGKKQSAETPPAVQIPGFIQKLMHACEEADVSTEDPADTVLVILEGAGLSPLLPRPPAEVEPPHQQHAEPLKQLNSVWNGETVLHVASAHGCSSLIPILMFHGADPTMKNSSGHTPYLVARNKEVRDSFRRFMAEHPETYHYERAYIPSPLTQEMEQERNRKEAEKRKEKKKARKQKQKETREEREVTACATVQQQATASLSEREKRAMAAERRLATQLPPAHTLLEKMGSCSGCGQSLGGVVPFERLDFKYCSMECLKQHRKQLMQK